MLDVVKQQFVGNTLVNTSVSGDVLDIGRRLAEGDATVGWDGDPSLSLHLAIEVGPSGDPLPNGDRCYEVWGIDEHNQPYLALSWPRADASMLRRLSEIDGRRHDVVERAVRNTQAMQRSLEQERAERQLDAADRLAFALHKDVGHLYGSTRRVL